MVDQTAFRVETAPGGTEQLPGPVTLQVTYPPDAVPPVERGRLVLGFLDGSAWAAVPDVVAEPAVMRMSARVNRSGVYALYRQP
jgi:hypothetical protein